MRARPDTRAQDRAPAIPPSKGHVAVQIPDPTEALVVRRLTDPDLLGRLLQREPVNPVDHADDPGSFARALTDRTDVDRRVFALVQPHDSTRVRTVLWVALTCEPAGSLVELTDDRAPVEPTRADTAVFWSIWNDDSDVRGAGSGLDLILGAAALLREELPQLQTFVTLSPAPGLRRWVGRGGAAVSADDSTSVAAAAARYLTTLDDHGTPIDPVARFHLRNGARLWRLLPDGDPSARGAARSFGLLANYRYEPEDREANQALLASGTVAVGDSVAALLS